MKNALLALAALTAGGAASAQSTVTVYGLADVGVQRLEGASRLHGVASGGMNGSRWGLRGVEDLGSGLKAKFQLESGINMDTGTSGQGGRIFGRTATVGLENDFGTVNIGRADTPVSTLSDESSTLGSKPNDLQNAAAMLGPGEFSRSDNSITYISPKLLGGLVLNAQYSLQFNGAELASKVGSQYGFNAIYKGSNLQAGAAYINLKADLADITETQLNLGWNFGVAAVKTVLTRDDYGTAKPRDFYGAEVSVPIDIHSIAIGAARLKNSTGLANVTDDANLWTVQGIYRLSRRTALYAFYTHVSNPGTGATPLATVLTGGAVQRPGYLRSTSGAGEDSSQLRIGLRHAF